MTTKLIESIPADADCDALITDLIRDAALEISNSYQYFRYRFEMISDYDDYIPAAATILAIATDAFFSHTHETPRECLSELLDNRDFINALATCDFNSPLFNFFDIDALIDYADSDN